MHWLRNLPIARKFVFAFGVICFLCLGLGAYNFFAFGSLAQKGAEVSQRQFPAEIAATSMRSAIHTHCDARI